MQILKLITQSPICEGLDFLIEEKSKDQPAGVYVSGIYMVSEEKNRNNRVYSREEMFNEVTRYNKEFVFTNRALGELEHPQSSTVNSERACHLITELRMDGDVVRGKSKILNTPLGQILSSLVKDGVKMGMSSRALGQLEERDGINFVKNMKLIAVDAVADPSAPGAFVNGILESKSFILNAKGQYEEYYDKFDNKLANLPRKDLNDYLREAVITFINSLK